MLDPLRVVDARPLALQSPARPTCALMVAAASTDPEDGTTYYFGCHDSKTLLTTADTARVYIPFAGEIKAAYLSWRASTAGSNNDISMYVRLNNTSDTLIATVSDTNQSKFFTNSALSIAVAAGDYFEIKMVSPTWSTNPLSVTIGGVVYVSGGW